MAEQKTKATGIPVESFLATVPDELMRGDCNRLINLMEKVTGEKPVCGVHQLSASGSIVINIIPAMAARSV